MIKKAWQHLQHKRMVRAWEKDIQKKAEPILNEFGYKKNSYEYQRVLNRIANRE